MERKVTRILVKWKQSTHRLPLILQGARQVGKTFSVMQFGKEHYDNIAYINFESSSEYHGVFERNLDPKRIIRELSILAGQSITEETLVFFDEIQACNRALTSLKYFAEQSPDYHIIAAGSLLGVALKRENYSFPVGKVDFLTMYPLDFEEFLWAAGMHEAVDIIRESYHSDLSCSIHDRMLSFYRQYLFLGGMPEVVREYLQSKDNQRVIDNQSNIVNAYIADMAKYASAAETVRIMEVFRSIPAQLAKENKKFQYSVIKSGARSKQYAEAISWLKASGIVNPVVKITSGKIPVVSHMDQESFKIYLSDPGLLFSRYGIPASMALSEFYGFEEVKGPLTENYVASALTFSGYTPWYWESEGKAEVDFVIQHPKGMVIPIEVKSSSNVRSKSLNQFIKKYSPDFAIRISTKNFGFDNNIKSIPLYAAFCI